MVREIHLCRFFVLLWGLVVILDLGIPLEHLHYVVSEWIAFASDLTGQALKYPLLVPYSVDICRRHSGECGQSLCSNSCQMRLDSFALRFHAFLQSSMHRGSQISLEQSLHLEICPPIRHCPLKLIFLSSSATPGTRLGTLTKAGVSFDGSKAFGRVLAVINSNPTGSVPVDVGHACGLTTPVLGIFLDNAQCINPQVSNAKASGSLDRVRKILRKVDKSNILQSVVVVVFQRSEVRVGGRPCSISASRIGPADSSFQRGGGLLVTDSRLSCAKRLLPDLGRA